MTEQVFLKSLENNILTIKINRTERRNAVYLEHLSELGDIIAETNSQDDIHAIVITGAGDYFCAGADISGGSFDFNEFVAQVHSKSQDTDFLNSIAPISHLIMALINCLKPVIAAVNGPAAGVGATMLCAMDFVLMSETAKMGFVFTQRGVVPEAGSSYLLPKMIGLRRACDWLLTGRLIEPQEALEVGFASSVYPQGAVLAEAYALANKLSQTCSRVSLASTRRLVWKFQGVEELKKALALELLCFADLLQKPDSKEGVKSFLEKRAPHFTGQVSQDLPEALKL